MPFSSQLQRPLPSSTLFPYTTLFRSSRHDEPEPRQVVLVDCGVLRQGQHDRRHDVGRSEEHTSELQSPYELVCRLLLEKKKCCWPACWGICTTASHSGTCAT